jgi:hypothetical protein
MTKNSPGHSFVSHHLTATKLCPCVTARVEVTPPVPFTLHLPSPKNNPPNSTPHQTEASRITALNKTSSCPFCFR